MPNTYNLQPGKKDGASVIICCYNSAGRITETLRNLAAQVIPQNFSLQIILVNNASADDTVAVAQQFWNTRTSINIEFKIINEPMPGQMFARIKGAQEATFETLVFCDDDNHLNKNYVAVAWQMLQKNIMIGAGGGINVPVTNAVAYPEWFEEYKNYYGLGIPAEKSGDVSYKGFVLGAGMVTRKSLFLQIFQPEYPSLLNGRDGKKLSTGDDFEYCKRLLLWGYTLYFDENLTLQHFIPKERLTMAYRENLMQGITDAGKVLLEYDDALRICKKVQHKNKWRLLLLSPLRILMSKLPVSKRVPADEKLILFYLSPFQQGNDRVKKIIKKFIQRK